MLCLQVAKFCVGPENGDQKMHAARKAAVAVDYLLSISALVVGILSMMITPFPIALVPAAQFALILGGGILLVGTVLSSIAEAREQSQS